MTILFLFLPIVRAQTPSNTLSIWTLNIAGGHTAIKLNTIYDQIMREQPDIFVLTDTRSDGNTIRAKDWKGYQIRESKGRTRKAGPFLDSGVLIGVNRHLPIVEDHKEVEGFEGRMVQMTIKIGIRGKGTKFKLIGVYIPRITGSYADKENQLFTHRLGNWLSSTHSNWLMAGDFNFCLDQCERPDPRTFRTTLKQSGVEEYRRLLSAQGAPGYDWWETRDRSVGEDYTRKAWRADSTSNDDLEDPANR
jgi:exonuclease III